VARAAQSKRDFPPNLRGFEIHLASRRAPENTHRTLIFNVTDSVLLRKGKVKKKKGFVGKGKKDFKRLEGWKERKGWKRWKRHEDKDGEVEEDCEI
jgi:hypothetical protein